MGIWYGIDLDRTLAYHDRDTGNEIGEPIPLMMERVKKMIADGKDVRIFTARASFPFMIPKVKEWCIKHGLGDLPVTNKKDFDLKEFWDDRAIQIIPNTGKRADGLE